MPTASTINPALDKHLSEGAFWEQEVYLSLQRSRKIAWIIASIAIIATMLCVIALVAITPLKELVPYVITVDSHTGYMEIAKPLAEGKGGLSKQRAITDYLAVRYIQTRESYNSATTRMNYATVQALSDGLAAKEHHEIWDALDDANPTLTLGIEGVIDIHIRGVEHLNDRTLQVRFQRKMRKDNRITQGNYTAILTYSYSNAKQTNAERLENPLGFKVINYRVAQDLI